MRNLPMDEAQYRGLVHITRKLDFFRSFTGEQVDKLFSHIQLYVFDKGETIFRKGESPNAFYIIYGGHVRIFLGYRFWGLMKKMAHLKAGDMFGEIALIENRPHSGTATAERTTQVFVLLRDDFNNLMKSDVEFADLMKFVVSRRKFETSR
jgi:CRP-like cAMP-binding protein